MPETDLRRYGGGIPVCTCERVPHSDDCPVAPFFEDSSKITLDESAGTDAPFLIHCSYCNQYFLQTAHSSSYDYTPTDGQTDSDELLLFCPNCRRDDLERPFLILCPIDGCTWTGTRENGVVDIWLERTVLKGVDTAVVRGKTYQRGQVVEEYTELSITCPDCGHSYGEDPE